jgi:hypothetical protein
MSRSEIEMEKAIDFLVRGLRIERLANPDFPQLSDAAARALATEVITRNGIINHQRNEQEAIAAVMEDPERWEFYGASGKLRRIFNKIFIKTEEVR